MPDTGIAGNVLYIKAYAGFLAVKTKKWRKLELVGQLAIMLGYFGKYEETYPWVSVQQLIADFTADIEQLRGDHDD